MFEKFSQNIIKNSKLAVTAWATHTQQKQKRTEIGWKKNCRQGDYQGDWRGHRR